MGRVVEQYVDEVVSTSRRSIHVVEDRAATVGLWHGGTLVDTVGTHGSVDRAIEAAGKAMRRFGIDARSTLHVRVSEKVDRQPRIALPPESGDWGPRYDAKMVAREVCVLRRHVWDSHSGTMEADPVHVGFEVVQWIGFRDEACDPGGQLRSCYRAVEVDLRREEPLWGGFGHGAAVITGYGREERVPDHIETRPGAVHHWAKVTLTGMCRILVPRGATEAALAGFLDECPVDVHLDRETMGRLPDRWDHYTGYPAASQRWFREALPPRALPTPDREQS